MKILLIHNFYQYWGGEDTYVTSLKKLLEENGHKVYLYSKDSKDIKTIWDRIKSAFGMFWNRQVEKELSTIIKDFKPHIAHFHNIYPLIGATAYRVCKKHHIPIIQHIHNYRFMCPKGLLFRNGKICELCVKKNLPFYSVLYGCYHRSRLASLIFSLSFFLHKMLGTFKLIDRFIFPSKFTMNYYFMSLGLPKKKATFIPYFVQTEKKRKNIIKKNYFLYVGRLSEEKGIIQLLEVFKTLPKLNLVLVGDGPLRSEVEKFKRYSNITIMGYLPRDEVLRYIKEAKVIIISSIWYEVLPFVYLEALMNNTPVLLPKNNNFVTSVGNIKNKSVFFYKFTDFNDLKKKIIEINNKELSKKTTTARKVQNSFTSAYHYQALMDEYRRLLHNLLE